MKQLIIKFHCSNFSLPNVRDSFLEIVKRAERKRTHHFISIFLLFLIKRARKLMKDIVQGLNQKKGKDSNLE